MVFLTPVTLHVLYLLLLFPLSLSPPQELQANLPRSRVCWVYKSLPPPPGYGGHHFLTLVLMLWLHQIGTISWRVPSEDKSWVWLTSLIPVAPQRSGSDSLGPWDFPAQVLEHRMPQDLEQRFLTKKMKGCMTFSTWWASTHTSKPNSKVPSSEKTSLTPPGWPGNNC